MDSKGSDEKFDIELGGFDGLGGLGELFQKNNLLERDPDNHDRHDRNDRHDRHDKVNKNYLNTSFIWVVRKMIECYKNNNYFGFSGLLKIFFSLFFIWFIILR